MVKVPTPPPNFQEALSELTSTTIATAGPLLLQAARHYPSWDELRRRTPPAGLTHRQWWALLKVGRLTQSRPLALAARDGAPFTYNLPDTVLESLDDINSRARGRLAAPEPIMSVDTRDRYLVSSLMEEAIRSSQLEGAVTTRRVAKELLRSQRKPRDRSERMIVNNYAAMQFVREHVDEAMTPALVCELHRIVTEGTLDNPAAAGRLQLPDEPRVGVWAEFDDVCLHEPPPAIELPERLERLCAFANGNDDAGWLPPLVRAVATHFMVGYDHYFEDGNGRTARALFYWVALKNGFWMLEFVAISRILRGAPAQYARSYLDTEADDGDVTYFIAYQLRVIRRALDDLNSYLARKASEATAARASASRLRLNPRQLAIVEGALRDGTLRLTARSHAVSHQVTLATSRTDLRGLESLGLLASHTEGRAEIWRPVPQFGQTLARVNLPAIDS